VQVAPGRCGFVAVIRNATKRKGMLGKSAEKVSTADMKAAIAARAASAK